MPETEHGFRYSLGNIKMKHVMSFSVLPLVTCAKDVPCKKDCYAARMCRFRTNVRDCYQKNTDMLKAGRYRTFIEDFFDVLQETHVDKFRFNVAGDFFCPEYLCAALDLATSCPDVKFWAFTKQWDVVKEVLKDCPKEEWPANFNLVLSRWGDYVPPKDLSDLFGICWFGDKEGKYPYPEDAFVCNGGCETCLACANLGPGQNVVIHQH